MKSEEKQIARSLRAQGLSLKEISRRLNVSKSTTSLWVRDIKLSEENINILKTNGSSSLIVEKRRSTRLLNAEKQRNKVIEVASTDIKPISEYELKILGAALYWAEGGKTSRGLVRFSNGDPNMIRLMMRFFREICKVPETKFRGYIHIHETLSSKTAELYWSSISKIPLSQFFKTYNKPNKSSKGLKNSLPYGTFDIYICDTTLFLTIKGWIQKISTSH